MPPSRLLLALSYVGGPAPASHDLPAIHEQPGIPGVLQQFTDLADIERPRPILSLDGFRQPAAIVDGGGDLPAAPAPPGETEDQLEQRLTDGVDLDPLLRRSPLGSSSWISW